MVRNFSHGGDGGARTRNLPRAQIQYFHIGMDYIFTISTNWQT